MKDQKFISGEFFEASLPKDDRYLLKYFTTDIQVQFVKYMQTFGDHKLFREHTGFACTNRNLQLLVLRLKKIREAHDLAKRSMNFEELASIERGEYKLNR